MKIKSLNTTLTNEDFKLIKKLLDLGVGTKEISNISKRSEGTIGAFKKVDTFEEYKTNLAVKYAKRKAEMNKPIKEFANGIFDQQKLTDSLDKLSIRPKEIPVVKEPVEDNTNEQLIRIANALERLAVAWEKQPEKKGWLK